MSSVAVPQASLAVENREALYEVVQGVRVELPPMGIYSSLLTAALYRILDQFVRQHRLGRVTIEALFVLDAATDLRRRPDVAYVSVDRWPLDRAVPTSGDWVVVPDLAVEVGSPKDLHQNVLTKTDEYFSSGVKQVWLVEPAPRKLYVYESPTKVRILTERDTLEGTLVPGFTMKIADLFEAAS